MSQPFTEIKEAIAEHSRPREERRSTANFIEAAYEGIGEVTSKGEVDKKSNKDIVSKGRDQAINDIP